MLTGMTKTVFCKDDKIDKVDVVDKLDKGDKGDKDVDKGERLQSCKDMFISVLAASLTYCTYVHTYFSIVVRARRSRC